LILDSSFVVRFEVVEARSMDVPGAEAGETMTALSPSAATGVAVARSNTQHPTSPFFAPSQTIKQVSSPTGPDAPDRSMIRVGVGPVLSHGSGPVWVVGLSPPSPFPRGILRSAKANSRNTEIMGTTTRFPGLKLDTKSAVPRSGISNVHGYGPFECPGLRRAPPAASSTELRY
jgi:hypothetical protein